MSRFDKPAVAIIGNLSDGFKVVGPFENFDAAAEFAEGHQSWITQILTPEEFLEEESDCGC